MTSWVGVSLKAAIEQESTGRIMTIIQVGEVYYWFSAEPEFPLSQPCKDADELVADIARTLGSTKEHWCKVLMKFAGDLFECDAGLGAIRLEA